MYEIEIFEQDRFDRWCKVGNFVNANYASMMMEAMLLNATDFHNDKTFRVEFKYKDNNDKEVDK